MKTHRVVILMLCLGFLEGCTPGVEWLDARDRAEPLMKRARMKRNEGDMDGAIELYREALRTDQRMALANLDLALLLHDEKKEYLEAACHYMRYLEARPDTEKSRMIRERMDLALQAYIAKQAPRVRAAVDAAVAKKPDPAARADLEEIRGQLEVAKRLGREAQARAEQLQEQNRILESTVRRLRSEVEQLEVVRAVEGNVPEDEPASVSRVRKRTYEVVSGDSLSSIASAIYGDGSKWRAIFEANREVLRGSQSLQPGQILEIP